MKMSHSLTRKNVITDGTAGVDDDPSGYYSVGEFRGEAGEYTVDGTHEFYTLLVHLGYSC